MTAPACPLLAAQVREDMAESALDCLVRHGACTTADLPRYGFLARQIDAHAGPALAAARRRWAEWGEPRTGPPRPGSPPCPDTPHPEPVEGCAATIGRGDGR